MTQEIDVALLNPREMLPSDSMIGLDQNDQTVRVTVDVRNQSYDSLTAAVAAITADPANIERVSTASYRNEAECLALGIDYPDGGAADYTIVPSGTGVDDGGSFIDAGVKQLKLLVKDGSVNILQFGAASVVDFDNAGSLTSAINFHALADIELKISEGVFEDSSDARNPVGNIYITGVKGKSWIKYHSSRLQTELWLENSNATAPIRSVAFVMDGVGIDGSSLPANRWLQNLAGAAITDPELDYYDAGTNPTGKIGNPAFPNYDVDDLITDDRRNPNYTTTSSILSVRGSDGGRVANCIFKNHFGRAITEQGSKDFYIHGNLFDTVGKNDGAYGAIWTQSFGTPGGGQPFYQDSENIRIFDNVAQNLERSFVTFGCTAGGHIYNNTVNSYGESCIFATHHLNSQWSGRSTIEGNVFNNGTLTDIASNAVELGGANRVDCHNNQMDSSGLDTAILAGVTSVNFTGNTSSNPSTATHYPYGPFSERYGYNQGTPPIAGSEVASPAHFVIGSLGSSGGTGLRIKGNILLDSRPTPAFPLRQTKSGSNNIAGVVVVNDNDLTQIENPYTLLDTTVEDVWLPSIPLTTKGNAGSNTDNGHEKVTQVVQIGETGALGINCGFRPSSVTVYGNPTLSAEGSQSIGEFSWREDGVRDDFAMTTVNTQSGNRSSRADTEVCRLIDTGNAIRFGAEFVSWTETGFIVNVQTALVACAMTFVCRP